MIASSRVRDGQAELFVQKRALSLVDLDRLEDDVLELFVRADVARVIVNLRAVERVDNSLVNLLRFLAGRARQFDCRFHAEGLPQALKYALSAPSFLMRWTEGVINPDARSPMGSSLLRGAIRT